MDSSKNNSPALILASASPRRKQLLGVLGISFSGQKSNIEESFNDNDRPADIVQVLARKKAVAVAQGRPQKIIIGADTMVFHRNNLLGKPQNAKQAIKMLQRLQNSMHQVITGITLLKTDANGTIQQQRSFYESTNVWFGTITQKEIEKYVATGSPFDRAGGYGIQDDWGAVFVKKIEGDYYNIVGLPVHALYKHLKAFAPKIFNS